VERLERSSQSVLERRWRPHAIDRWPTTPACPALPLKPSQRSTMATDTQHAKTQILSQRTIANLIALRRPRLVVLSLKKEIEQALGEGLTLAELWRASLATCVNGGSARVRNFENGGEPRVQLQVPWMQQA